MTTKLAIGILASKSPMNRSVLGVASSLPGGHLFCEEFLVADSAVQALAAECSDLELCHIQPTPVLGRVVEDHAAQELARFPRAKDLDEARSEVCVEVVDHQMDASGRTVNDVDQALHESDEVCLPSVVGNL